MKPLFSLLFLALGACATAVSDDTSAPGPETDPDATLSSGTYAVRDLVTRENECRAHHGLGDSLQMFTGLSSGMGLQGEAREP